MHGLVAVKKLLTAQFERDCGKCDKLIFPNTTVLLIYLTICFRKGP